MTRPMLVLNTRPPEQATELSRLLRLAGLAVVEAPAIVTRPAWREGELERVRGEIDTFDWVVLASANAGRGLEAELNSRAERVVCGVATAKALSLAAATVLDKFSATAALGALRMRLAAGERVLVPRAAEGRNELLDGLRLLHVDVHAPVAYRTLAVEDAANRLREGGVDVVAVCSPSAVVSVASALGTDVRIVCLGATTAYAARAAGLRVDAVASATSMRALAEAIHTLVGAPV